MTFGDRFLTRPEQLPMESVGGEPYGDRDLVLDLVGGPYRVSGLGEAQEHVVRSIFDSYLIEPPSSVDPAVTVRVFRAEERSFRRIELDGWTYTFDIDCAPNQVRLAGRNFVARLDWQPGIEAGLWLTRDPVDLELSVHNFFRVLVANRLLEVDGVLLHSSSVIDSNRALVFYGPSGAGKSTIARLSLENGMTVLGDDLNVVRRVDGVVTVEDFPLAGDLRRPVGSRGAFPVVGLYRLRHGSRTSLRPLAAAEAHASLFASAPFVSCDVHRLDRLTARLRAILEFAAAGELIFSRESSFADIQRCLEGQR